MLIVIELWGGLAEGFFKDLNQIAASTLKPNKHSKSWQKLACGSFMAREDFNLD